MKHNNHTEHSEFIGKIVEEDAKGEENENKTKEDIVRLKDKQENIAFFDLVNKRLMAKHPATQKVSSTSELPNFGQKNIRRLSFVIPGLIDRQSTLTKQRQFFSKQSSLIPNLSRKHSLRPLPITVRQPSFMKQINDAKKQLGSVPTEDKKTEAQSKIDEKQMKEDILQLEKFLDSTGTIVVMAIATIFVLFGDDINTLALPISFDLAFDITKTVCFALFILEIIFSCVAKHEYALSFFFWLDIISTLSLIQDIGFMINPLVYGSPYINII